MFWVSLLLRGQNRASSEGPSTGKELLLRHIEKEIKLGQENERTKHQAVRLTNGV